MGSIAKVAVGKKGAYLIGEGRYSLISSIGRTGSLSSAAGEMGMSYRHAWGVIRHLEEELGEPLVISKRGGKNGGRTELTPLGVELMEEFETAREAVVSALNGRLFRAEAVLVARSEDRVYVSGGALPRVQIDGSCKDLGLSELKEVLGIRGGRQVAPRVMHEGKKGVLLIVHELHVTGSAECELLEPRKLNQTDRRVVSFTSGTYAEGQ